MLHTEPGDQLSGTARPKQPIGEWGETGWCAVERMCGSGGGAALAHTSTHSPTSSVPSGLSAKRIS